MGWTDQERRALQADRRAVIAAARELVARVDDQLRTARLRRAIERPRLRYKTNWNALVSRPRMICR